MFVKFRYLFAFLLILLIPFQALSDQAEQSDTSENAVLLILGDSLSAAYGLQQHEGWVSLLQKMWQDDNIPIDIVNAAVKAIQRFPLMNCSLESGNIVHKKN